MTIQDILATDYNIMTDRPKVHAPHRAQRCAYVEVLNEHGVKIAVHVETNRTGNRWWLTSVYPKDPSKLGDTGWLRGYWTTTSRRKAEEWIAAINEVVAQ